jgi:Domain of unknown function (DUF4129)
MDEALQNLHAILAQPEFQAERSRFWWERLWAPVGETVRGLLGQLAAAFGDSISGREGWVGWTAVVVAGLFLGAGLLFLVGAVRLAVVRDTRLRDDGRAQRRQRSDQLYQEAQRLAAAGQFAAAARPAYLSALYALDEHALLRVQGGLTNREHARQLSRTDPHLGEQFAALVQRYDRVRYGRYALSAEAYVELNALVDQHRRRVGV